MYDKLEHYEPDEEIKKMCTNYIFFLFFYNSVVLMLLIYSFFQNNLSPYGWLFFMNLYFCVFPIFTFMRSTFIPSLLRFYNWMLAVASIISTVLCFQGLFLFTKINLYLIIFYTFITIFNCAFCWEVTQNIYDGRKAGNDLLGNLNSDMMDESFRRNNRQNFNYPINTNLNRGEPTKEQKKTFLGEGKTIRDSNYVQV